MLRLAFIPLGLVFPLLAAAEPIEFSRDIRPILTRHCTKCHGGVKAAGDVSFVYREKALAAIQPGKPAESELIRRVLSRDPEERMPLGDDAQPLTAKEIQLLQQWIAAGAAWSEPWSFVPPREAPEPAVKHAAWPVSKLDRFVLAKLEGAGLAPSPAAGPAEWLRRASLDLIGLPPTAEEWEAFEQAWAADPRAAKVAAVQRLLASPHFGERWGTVWLDLARYSDTYGFEKDPHRDIWPWRDWVIRALNADMPFDTFTIKQLAGDLLENPAPDDLLATAFHRNTQNNTEGGTDDEEYRYAAVIDRVNTTWTAWQGTTFGCVRCHSHPYDPYRNIDYYRALALFNNTEDCDQNDDFPRSRAAADPQRQAEVVELERRIRALRNGLNQGGIELAAQTSDWSPLTPASLKSSGGQLEVKPGGSIAASGTLPIGVVYTLTAPARSATAIRIQIFPEADDPKKLPERGAVLSKLDVVLIDKDGQRRPVPLKEVLADSVAGPFDPQATLADDPGGLGDFPVLRGKRWGVVVPQQPIVATEGAQLELTLKQSAASNSGFQACTLRRFQIDTTNDPRWSALVAAETRDKQWQELHQARAALQAVPGTLVPILVERSGAAQRETRVTTRGNLAVKGEAVEPGLPEIFAGAPTAGGPRLTRLDLAKWLVGEQNTLTSRVLANRLWGELFGRGIVETQEDFGSSGVPPSHPELLDYLAVRLVREHRWSIKKLLAEIVLSATYGQTAKATPDTLAKDPENRLLARGPRVRLTAEMVRDQGLAVSGLLSRKAFGPPVYPPQPEGVWSTVYSGATWKTSAGEDRYRRAIYTYSKRTSGYPGLLTFDAPSRDGCSARRVATNTPLQALVSLNDPANIEMAQAFARRMEQAGGTLDEKIDRGHRWLLLQPASAETLQILRKLHAEALAEFSGQPGESAKLAPQPESAALVLVAHALLNLDAAIAR